MKSLGLGSIAGMRLSQDSDSDLSVSTISQCQCSASPHTSHPSCPKACACSRSLWDSSVLLGANQTQTALFEPLGPLLALSRPCPPSHFSCCF